VSVLLFRILFWPIAMPWTATWTWPNWSLFRKSAPPAWN